MMQWQIPFQKQSFLFTAGESAGEPGGEDAAQDAQAGQAEEGQVQMQAENRIICDKRQDNTVWENSNYAALTTI